MPSGQKMDQAYSTATRGHTGPLSLWETSYISFHKTSLSTFTVKK